MPTAVIPYSGKFKHIALETGVPSSPYLADCRSQLESAGYDAGSGVLNLTLRSFPGHADMVTVITPAKPSGVFVDGQQLIEQPEVTESDGVYSISFGFTFKNTEAEIRMEFE